MGINQLCSAGTPSELPLNRPDYESLSQDELVALIAGNDRDAAAAFIARCAPIIRQRFRSHLSPALRRLLDSSDVISTVSRRLDQLVQRGGLQFVNERQLWGLINQLAKAAIVDKARALKRLREMEDPEGEWSRAFLVRVEHGERESRDSFDETLGSVMDAAGDDRDRQVLAMWLQGAHFAQMGSVLGLDAGAVRQLWHRIRARLKQALVGVHT